MKLVRGAWLLALGMSLGCEVPEGKLGEDLDASEHDHDAHTHMDAGSQHDASHHDGGDAGDIHAGYGLHTRPSNITCVAPSFSASAEDAGVAELMPELLSQTGCFQPGVPTTPIVGMIPFELNSALWSDGASKRRWMALPGLAKIKVVADGDFEFPPGTMLVKEFSLGGRLLETRFMVHHPESVQTDAGVVEVGRWIGYTYQWNAEQTEATLVPRGATTPFVVDPADGALGMWQVPNREECMTCHTIAAGRALGPEISQFNRDYTYESTGTTANQLKTLDHIGMFEEPLPAADSLQKLVNPQDETGDLDARARAYLHANCSFCHRKPAGDCPGPDDFRVGSSLVEMGICNALPTIPAALPELGIDADAGAAHLLSPLSPETSVMWKRMQSRGPRQMPPIATKKPDQDGLNLIAQWINSISECPVASSP